MTAQVRDILGDLRRYLESVYGARLVGLVLYGSEARGEADAGSDVDVLVVLDGMVDVGREIRRTGAGISELSLKHDRTISRLFIDARSFRERQGPFLRNVRREGIAA
jgi:predicted nucleotidyltransferase